MNFRVHTFVFLFSIGLCFSVGAQSGVDCVGNVPSDLVIPNVITPNSDGKNDEFKVVSANLTKLRVEIFNRWGLRVYTFEGVNGIWDGTAFGSLLDAGTYFYSIEYNSSCSPSLPMKVGGFITLIRSN